MVTDVYTLALVQYIDLIKTTWWLRELIGEVHFKRFYFNVSGLMEYVAIFALSG